MRKARAGIAVMSAAAITALTVTAAGAATQSGVGTSQGSATVFSLDLGATNASAAPSLLSAELIGDLGSANSDPAQGASSALSRLGGLVTTSQLVKALDLSVPSTPVEAQSPGGQPAVSTPAISLSDVDGVGVPTSVASGTIDPASLSASVAASGVQSGLSAGVSNIALAGGLVSLGSAKTAVTNSSNGSEASSVRSVQAGPLTVLSLGQLLSGLGLPLSDLPLTTLSSLLGSLHLTLPSVPGAGTTLPSGTTLTAEVGALTQAVESITTELKVPASALIAHPNLARAHLSLPSSPVSVSSSGQPVITLPTVSAPSGLPTGSNSSGVTSGSAGDLTSSAISTLSSELQPVLDALGVPVNVSSTITTLTSLTSLLDSLQGDLSSVLDQALSTLDSAALLKVDGLNIGLTATATNAVKSSVAQVTGTVGTVSVGNLLTTPTLSLTSPLSTVSSVVSSVDSAIDGVLSDVSPALGSLVKVSVLTPVAGNGVSTSGKYVKAVEGITALTATITPPADLSSLVSTVTSAVNVGDTASGLLGVAGVPTSTITELSSALSPIATLSATLDQTLGALANGAVLKVGTLQAASDFAAAPVAGTNPAGPSTPGNPAPTPAKGTLPFTGGNSAVGAFGAAGLALLVGARRFRLTRKARRA